MSKCIPEQQYEILQCSHDQMETYVDAMATPQLRIQLVRTFLKQMVIEWIDLEIIIIFIETFIGFWSLPFSVSLQCDALDTNEIVFFFLLLLLCCHIFNFLSLHRFFAFVSFYC